ncbi:hypothetical protein [Carboxylicivirga sp. RSCT41]|uniref:hypothetical protein n=1 Tax=Carboxylicivirga agarovorans TaxID=3417570 RepID=UPI003D34A9AD
MILFLFAATSLGAQTAKADSCKAERKEQCTKVKEEKEVVMVATKQNSKEDKKKENGAKSIEEGFIFKRQSIQL